MINVPYFKQDLPYSCGSAALQMLFAHYGVRVSETELTEVLRAGIKPKDGTPHERMIREVLRRGFYAYVNEYAAFDEVENLVRRHTPVLVEFIEPSNNEGHFAVVVGVEDGDVVLNDSWNGEHFHLSRPRFEAVWHSEGGDSHRWFMAISPEPFSTGKQYIPKHPHSE